jgi:hypothetical protein
VIAEADAFAESANARSASTTRYNEENSVGDARSTKSRSWLLWVTMGLFASLAGNVFFGWVAWDTHTRYQDLVDDVHEAERRLKRQQLRPQREEARSRNDLSQRDAT